MRAERGYSGGHALLAHHLAPLRIDGLETAWRADGWGTIDIVRSVQDAD